MAVLRNVGKKILLASGSLVLVVVLLEAVLQIATLAMRDMTRGVGWKSPSTTHVLCLGDSNTFGLSVAREQSYPARLQTRWNEAGLSPAIEVMNLGYPSTNSYQVLRDLNRNLELFQPDVVLLKIGTNDFWTVPVAIDETTPQPFLARLRQWSRVYRLLYLATRDPDESPLKVTTIPGSNDLHGKGQFEYLGQVFELGHEKALHADYGNAAGLARNLNEIVARVRQRGVRLVILNYASETGFYKISNQVLRKVAEETGTPFVDVRAAFVSSVCPQEPCPDWIFPQKHVARGHPTAVGYDLAAKTAVEVLRSVLVAEQGRGEPEKTAPR